MRAYVGQTRGRALIKRLTEYGIGECTVRGQLPPRRTPWFYDNGAFGDWRNGKPFDSITFAADLHRMIEGGAQPDFVVLPDLVAQGSESLAHSMDWLDRCKRFMCYLAVQDGMEPREVSDALPWVQGLFVGGTTEWKWATAAQWCDLAHSMGRPCHIGRVGSIRNVKRAYRAGADSIDSNAPLFVDVQLRNWISAMDFMDRQQEVLA